jgi:phosphoesterase RecJ-like protein
MLERTGAGPGDSEGLVDYPRSIAGVLAVALFRELPDGRVKASLRSRGDVDVEKVARRHGGGGHKNAAGCTLSPRPEHDVEGEIVLALKEALTR